MLMSSPFPQDAILENKQKNIPGLDEFLKKVGVENCDTSFEELSHFVSVDIPPEAVQNPYDIGARWQDVVIESIVGDNDSVLDIGCGAGDLMARLSATRGARVQGLEMDEEMVIRCIERGMPVYHGDIETCLKNFTTKSFDFAILEETLQTLQHPLIVLKELLRIGRKCIVSFPNFAHWNVRLSFSLGGRMPKTESLPNTWYNTPNIHLCSIHDFLDFTKEAKVKILESWVLENGKIMPYQDGHNLTAEQAMFVIEKK